MFFISTDDCHVAYLQKSKHHEIDTRFVLASHSFILSFGAY